MPSSLFDYVDGPIHPMGESPDLPTFCKTARIDCRLKPDSLCCGGEVDPLEDCRFSSDQQRCSGWWAQNRCVVNYTPGQGITSVQCPAKPKPPTPPQPPKPPTGPLCNPSSVGKRFSFNFPSGKKWTLSQKDDASARGFYCGGSAPQPASPDTIVCPDGFDTGLPIGAKTLVDPCRDHPEIADLLFCSDGTKSSARKGCPPGSVPVTAQCFNWKGNCSMYPNHPCCGPGTPPTAVMSQPNCPPTTHNEGLIQQAKMMGYNNAFQVRYGSTNIPDPREHFAQFKDCPIYGQLMSAYAEEYNRYLQLFPQLSPIR